MEYVVGFAFNQVRTHVLLVRKTRPAWQAGLLNGVGGKIEEGEGPLGAMVREFAEEAGMDTSITDWQYHVRLVSGADTIYFFSTEFPIHRLVMKDKELNDVGETLELWAVRDFVNEIRKIPNLSWIVPLLAYQHDTYQAFKIEEA